MKKNWRNLVCLGPKLVLLTGALVFACQGLGQGVVNFVNYVSGAINAPIYDVGCKTLLADGGQFLVQLYAAPLGNTSLEPVGSAIPISANGYFTGGTTLVPNIPPFGTADLQVRAWRAADGATFELADHPGGQVGESAVFALGPLPSPDSVVVPPNMIGLQSFCLTEVIPEPPVWSLGLLGVLILVLRFRRRPKAVARL